MANFDNKFWNVSDIRNAETNDFRAEKFENTFPNNDAEASPHVALLKPSVYRPTEKLREALKTAALQKTYGKPLASWAVGDRISIAAVASDSRLVAVGWKTHSINGLVGKLVLVDEDGLNPVDITGIRNTRVERTQAAEAPGAPADNIGAAVEYGVVEPDLYVGPVRYVAFEITALPANFADCPEIPDIQFEVTYMNLLNTYRHPNV